MFKSALIFISVNVMALMLLSAGTSDGESDQFSSSSSPEAIELPSPPMGHSYSAPPSSALMPPHSTHFPWLAPMQACHPPPQPTHIFQGTTTRIEQSIHEVNLHKSTESLQPEILV